MSAQVWERMPVERLAPGDLVRWSRRGPIHVLGDVEWEEWRPGSGCGLRFAYLGYVRDDARIVVGARVYAGEYLWRCCHTEAARAAARAEWEQMEVREAARAARERIRVRMSLAYREQTYAVSRQLAGLPAWRLQAQREVAAP